MEVFFKYLRRIMFFVKISAFCMVTSKIYSFSRMTQCLVYHGRKKESWRKHCMLPYRYSAVKLKMLGLYLYTLLISHKSCKMLSILNKLLLQRDLQNFVTNKVLMDKVKTQQQQNRKSNIKTLAGAGNWTRDLLHPKRMRYHCTTKSTESIYC